MVRARTAIILAAIIIAVAAGLMTGSKWARKHVNYMTAVEDHPIACWRCHLYTQEDNLIARWMNETYVSPYTLAISEDGSRLYVVGQESNELVVADALENSVLEKISVGERPHSVILGPDGKRRNATFP